MTDGFLIQTTHLTGTKPTDTTNLKNPAAAASYYNVLSGTPLRDVTRELEEYGRGLRNMGPAQVRLDISTLYIAELESDRRHQTSTWSVYLVQAPMALKLLSPRLLI